MIQKTCLWGILKFRTMLVDVVRYERTHGECRASFFSSQSVLLHIFIERSQIAVHKICPFEMFVLSLSANMHIRIQA